MNGICNLFEASLKQQFPGKKNITYDVSQLFQYIDELPDCSVLIFDDRLNAYAPYGKEWVKKRIFVHLKKVAGAK
eukprot:CAMPEP_0177665842 /NCGR_PEP_ID=MMETSP0447-20121125/21268_1 /TAXON_ID=0 /ORGANISM="Stygamoeba regulata, Strain BSH-02190019" /LENGTH=74 /DNA_ID=CAMNT_0019171959 /DNA_START=164 /DNA_END=388 /DNA_ORIENTATION=-